MTKNSATLQTATAITIRRLWTSERDLFRAHFDQLDPASRAARFGAPVHDSFLDVYARSAFSNGNMVFGAFVKGNLLGVGETKLLANSLPLERHGFMPIHKVAPALWKRSVLWDLIDSIKTHTDLRAEAAFSVVPEWQGNGVGDALFARIVAALQNRGVGSVSLWCRRSNHRMLHLADKHNSKLDFVEGDETHGEVRLPWPMPSSIIEEVCGEAICYAQAMQVWMESKPLPQLQDKR